MTEWHEGKACAITDEDTAHRLASLINAHMGDTNE